MSTPLHFPATQTRELFTAARPLRLESGATLGPVTAAYETYGQLNAGGSNAVLVCHALTGSAHAADLPGDAAPSPMPGWWNGIIGPGRALDPERFFIVCVNILGSCYGTTGPASTDPATGRPYGAQFPQVTVRDMVRVQRTLLDTLGVSRLAAVIGGSLGGMQVLEWGVLFPGFARRLVPVATAARHSAWCIALNEASRLAITNDPCWHDGAYTEQPARGLALARMIAMISYRSEMSFALRHGRAPQAGPASPLFPPREDLFSIEGYLRYQGEKLVGRFDANSYLCITRAMDLHDVTTGRGTLAEVLGSISCPVLCIGIDSDRLYPAREQQEIAALIPSAAYREIRSPHGHDAFLIEFDQMNPLLREFIGA